MSELTREQLVEAARGAARGQSEPLTRKDFIRKTGITEWQINCLFPEGRWSEVRKLAGIERHPLDRKTLSDDELLSSFHQVVESLGEIPTWAVFNAKSDVSSDTLRRRFGGLQQTMKAYRSWLERLHPDSPLLDLVSAQSRHQIPTPPTPAEDTPVRKPATWAPTDGAQFGPPIDFRGLRHAPINEQGVVYLFGMVSYELGFIVEAVQSSYPDCEAKRQVGKDRWQRVRIEFEYRSVNFRDHGHDPNGADLIVCWEHNWTECPLEVLELRAAIDRLEN